MNGIGFIAIPILLVLNAQLYRGQLLRSPPINIAAGKPITATATCGVGVSEPELYCKLATVPGKFGIKGLECDRCIPDSYSRDHAIKYAVDGSEKWWQSPPLSRGLNYQRVNITINLGQVNYWILGRNHWGYFD
jgi:laminin alpha 3/5